MGKQKKDQFQARELEDVVLGSCEPGIMNRLLTYDSDF